MGGLTACTYPVRHVMHASRIIRISVVVVCFILVLAVCGIIALRLLLSRTREFRAQARAGQPIVRAVEDFRKQSGSYPSSLTNLVPQYLPTLPDIQQEGHYKRGSWEYRVVTNGTSVSYSLRSYMGRGGVEYEPPIWTGNDDGHRTVLLRND